MSLFVVIFHYREVQGVPDTVPEGGVAPPPLDSAWAESTRKKALLKLEKLDTDLKNYKGNSIKESIRYYIIGMIFFFSPTVDSHSSNISALRLADVLSEIVILILEMASFICL